MKMAFRVSAWGPLRWAIAPPLADAIQPLWGSRAKRRAQMRSPLALAHRHLRFTPSPSDPKPKPPAIPRWPLAGTARPAGSPGGASALVAARPGGRAGKGGGGEKRRARGGPGDLKKKKSK